MGGVNQVSHFGIPVSKDDGSVVVYAQAHADLQAFNVYAVKASRDIRDNNQDGNPDNTGFATTKVPATLAVDHFIGVPQKDVNSGEIAELVIGGSAKMNVDNVSGAIVGGSTFLKVLDSGHLGQADGTTQTVNSVALACEDQNSATASAINVQMLGKPAQV